MGTFSSPSLFLPCSRLSDETKKLVLTPVYVDKVYRSGINADDVTFVDTAKVLYIYIGPGANDNERNSVWAQSDVSLRDLARNVCVVTYERFWSESDQIVRSNQTNMIQLASLEEDGFK